VNQPQSSSPAPVCREVVHPGILISEDIRRLGLTQTVVALLSGVASERLLAITQCRAYPNVKDSARLGPVLGRGRHNLYRCAQAHRLTQRQK
jgi:hypothetical protein